MGEGTIRLLPVAALQADSLILDDQDNHLVMTLRVPKELIRKNNRLLMALASRSLGRDSDMPQWPKPEPAKPKRLYWPYAAVVLLALSLFPSPAMVHPTTTCTANLAHFYSDGVD